MSTLRITHVLHRGTLRLVCCLSVFAAAMALLAQVKDGTVRAQTEVEATAEIDSTNQKLVCSLLTCGPGKESYELYGHTALRIRDGKEGTDEVYNYGYFNFKRPNFVWHFVLGETDYSLRPMTWEHFLGLYMSEGRWVEEQILNLTDAEADRLNKALEANRWQAMHEGWTYRYNYLTDNCTTRAIDQIRAAIDDSIQLPASTPTTYRKALHEFTHTHPWAEFGNDMLLGKGCDEEIDAEGQLFLPIPAKELLDGAQVKRSPQGWEPLVRTKERIYFGEDEAPSSGISPMFCAWLMLILTLCITFFEWLKGLKLWGYDALLLFVQGIAGCIIAFMFCFSEHPTVDSNMLIIWLNPLPLLFMWPAIKQLRRHKKAPALWLQVVMIGIFYVSAAAGLQGFPPETYVLALCLLIRAAAGLYIKQKA